MKSIMFSDLGSEYKAVLSTVIECDHAYREVLLAFCLPDDKCKKGDVLISEIVLPDLTNTVYESC